MYYILPPHSRSTDIVVFTKSLHLPLRFVKTYSRRDKTKTSIKLTVKEEGKEGGRGKQVNREQVLNKIKSNEYQISSCDLIGSLLAGFEIEFMILTIYGKHQETLILLDSAHCSLSTS